MFLSEPLVGYANFHAMLTVSVTGELWLLPLAVNTDDPTALIFTMNGDASATTLWRVPGPANYQFAGGGTLAEPFEGSIG